MARYATACNAEHDAGLLKATHNFELPDGDLPTEVMLIPPGPVVEGRDGRKYLNNDPAGVVAFFADRGVDLPFDWLHATELRAPKGEEAPAAGWGRLGTMTARPDGSVWINVEWTARGAESIKNREYRYISPVYLCEPNSMAIRGLSSVGLTNKPNVYIPALNGEGTTRGGNNTMIFLQKLALLLGLPETATEEQCLNHCKEQQDKLSTALNQAQNPPLTLFVPRSDYDALLAKCANLEQSIAEGKKAELAKEVNAEIEAALKAGKIVPATREYYEKQCNSAEGLAAFREFVKAAPALAAPSGLDNQKPLGEVTALNAEEQKIAAMFGNSIEDLKKYGGM